jgi:hypothetical protein
MAGGAERAHRDGPLGAICRGVARGERIHPEAIARLVEVQELREVKPPFTDRTPLIAFDGAVWVERSVADRAPPAWDRFDSRGVFLGGVILPAGRRLLALGPTGACAALVDSGGIERLERRASLAVTVLNRRGSRSLGSCRGSP